MSNSILPVSLKSSEARQIRESFEMVSPGLVTLASDFYDRLFDAAPELRVLFPQEMGPQLAKLAHTLSWAVSALRDRDILRDELHSLGRFHLTKGVRPEYYDLVIEALLGALKQAMGPRWTDALEQNWRRLLEFIGTTMIEGCDAPKTAAGDAGNAA